MNGEPDVKELVLAQRTPPALGLRGKADIEMVRAALDSPQPALGIEDRTATLPR